MAQYRKHAYLDKYLFIACDMAGTRSQPLSSSHIIRAILILLGACLVKAASTDTDCSTCPLAYDPVIHTASGLLFYNECLARCQLGDGAELESAAPKAAKRNNPTIVRATAKSSTTTGTTAAAADAANVVAGGTGSVTAAGVDAVPGGGAGDAPAGNGAVGVNSMSVLLQLLPEPDGDDTHATAHPLTAAVVGRFRKEGFMFVGRPGRGRTARPADVLNKDKRPKKSSKAGSKDADGDGDGLPDVVYTLRFAYDTGDLYMRTMGRTALKQLVQQASVDPQLKALARPQLPLAMRATAAATSASSNNSSSGNEADGVNARGSGGRRGLMGRQRQPAVQKCPRCKASRTCLCVTGQDDRRQVAAAEYPLSAVAQISMDDMYSCSGAVVGSDSRLVLTAGHCVYDTDSRSFFRTFLVTPGLTGGNVRPYGAQYAKYVDVKAEYRSPALTYVESLHFDTGVLALAQPSAGGSLGYDVSCGTQDYQLTSAGYPGDKPPGTMWVQSVALSTDVCSGTADKLFGFDVASGQSGSSFWTVDAAGDHWARLTVSYSYRPGSNGGVAITPATYAWLLQFALGTGANSTSSS